jgi:Big-like domain-containing protein
VNQAVNSTVQGTDVDGDALTFEVVRAPRKGTLSLNANTGAFVYTPNGNFAGTDTFTFRARDAATPSSTGTVKITASP